MGSNSPGRSGRIPEWPFKCYVLTWNLPWVHKKLYPDLVEDSPVLNETWFDRNRNLPVLFPVVPSWVAWGLHAYMSTLTFYGRPPVQKLCINLKSKLFDNWWLEQRSWIMVQTALCISWGQFHGSDRNNITNDFLQPDGCDILIGKVADWRLRDAWNWPFFGWLQTCDFQHTVFKVDLH